MNFKKNWKRFWTLSSAREGFTLVELIVVIAILAILAGVAVPAYSGYVTKANMQADMTLASEVAHALTLYYYAHPEEVVSGHVALGLEESSASNDAMTAAMDAVFGDGWEQTAVLKYDNWAEEGGFGNVGNSTLGNMEASDITGAVTGLTGLAGAVIGSNDPDVSTRIISTLFGDEGKAIAEELKQYESDPNYSTIASNLLVKYFADDIGSAEVVVTDGIAQPEGIGEMSQAGVIYAMLFSMANSDSPYSEYAEEKLDAFNASLEQLKEDEANDPTGTHVTQRVGEALQALYSDEFEVEEGKTFGAAFVEYVSANEGAEVSAVIEAMGLVNNVSGEFTADDLKNPEMFNSDAMVNTLTLYKLAASSNGIVISVDNGIVSVIPSILGE